MVIYLTSDPVDKGGPTQGDLILGTRTYNLKLD